MNQLQITRIFAVVPRPHLLHWHIGGKRDKNFTKTKNQIDIFYENLKMYIK